MTPKDQHYLFHIFRMDKADNPMPDNRAASLLQLLKITFLNLTTDKEKP